MMKKKGSHTRENKTTKRSNEVETTPPSKPIPRRPKGKSSSPGFFNYTRILTVLLSLSVLIIGVLIANSSLLTSLKKVFINVKEETKIHKKVGTSSPPKDFNISRGIDRRSNLSLQEFIDLYDAKWPVLITDAMKDWPAMRKWNKEFFLRNYGNKKISFKGVQGNINDRKGLSADLRIFLDHIHMSSPDTWTYLEDEIFLMRNKELRSDIRTPIYLKEDFFALLPEEVRPWNAMLLWGTKYSRSSLHIDPYNWTGTNAVLKGRKAWKLYPPGQDKYLYVRGKTMSGFPLECYKYQSDLDMYNIDPKQHPLALKAKAVEFVQHPGELLIIPTGWFHQAYNEEETMAISSQVMNSQNYKQVLEEILKAGNVRERDIPSDVHSMEPREQVEAIFSKIPERIVRKGKMVTRDILRQLQDDQNGKLHFS